MVEDEIKVSIYCLAYNHGPYIRQCLDGFVNQKTDFKYEVIVHDDASTDDTAKIIKEYADRYPYVIKPIFQTENQYSKGVVITKQIIIPKMRGKYVAVCEGDDYWCDECKLQKQADIMDNNPDFSACVHQTKLIDCLSGNESLISPFNKTGIIDKNRIFSDVATLVHTSSLFYRRSTLDNLPEFCYISKSVGDYPFEIYLALLGPIYYINEVMSVYRLFTASSWSLKQKNDKSHIPFYKEMIAILESADKCSDYKYHEYFDIPILEYEYRCWKENPKFLLISNERFHRLKFTKKIKLIFRAAINKIKMQK